MPGRKKVRPAANRRKRGKTAKPFANGALGNRHVERAVVSADDRVSLVVEILELRIVDPDIHCEFELANQARAADERGDAPLHAVVRRASRQRRPVSGRGGSSSDAACSPRCRAGSCGGCARRSDSDNRAGRPPVENRLSAADRRRAPGRLCPDRAPTVHRCAIVPSASPRAVPAGPTSPIAAAGNPRTHRRAPPCAGRRDSCHCVRGPPAAAAAVALRSRRRTRGRTHRPSPPVPSPVSAARPFPR